MTEEASGMTSIPSAEEQLLNGIEQRQNQTLSHLPRYGKITFWVAVLVLLLGISIQAIQGTLPNEQLQLVESLKNPSIGGILSLTFTLFAYVVNSIFAVWALSFIPYITIRAYKTSQKTKLPVRSKGFRWLQLFASSLFPTAVFAMFWTNLPSIETSFVIKLTPRDGLIILAGGLLVWGMIYFATKYIPLRYIILHITLFSGLLYTTIFLAYGLGFGVVTYSVVLGIFLYLMFTFNSLSEIGRRICIYDLDHSVSDKVSSVAAQEDNITLKEVETNVGRLEKQLQHKIDRLNNEDKISKQMIEISKTKIDFNAKVNETILKSFNQRCRVLNQMYDILARELDTKVNQELPKMIADLSTNAKHLSSTQLRDSMNEIIAEMDGGLNGIPESMERIKLQMLEATKKLRAATEQLADENRTS